MTIAGVILNRVGSHGTCVLHPKRSRRAGLPVIGALPRNAHLELPERHLGLVQAEETSELDDRLNALADFIEANVDVDRLLQSGAAGFDRDGSGARFVRPEQRIALARDAAFSFVYPHLSGRLA